MGFNMSSMNSSSIMPSVTSISPTLNTSTVPYGSQHTPATTRSDASPCSEFRAANISLL